MLGTAALAPLPGRALTAGLLACAGRCVLFDCGEGTQSAARAAGVSLMKTDLIALTHYSQMIENPETYLPNAAAIFPDTVCGLDGMSKTLRFE